MPEEIVEVQAPEKAPTPSDTYALGDMTEREVVDFVNAQAQEFDHRIEPLRNIQDRLWQLYRNQEDFSDKEDWQSKVGIPKAFSVVKTAAANIVKLLFSTERWLSAKGYGIEETVAPIVEECVQQMLRSRPLEFKTAFQDSLESGLAVGVGIIKEAPTRLSFYPAELQESAEKPTERVTLRAWAVDYRRFRYGPYTTSKHIDWCIEDSEVPYAYLARDKRVKHLDDINRESWDRPGEESGKDAERFDFAWDAYARHQHKLNKVGIREYWGPIINPKTQELLTPMAHIVLLNRQYLGLLEAEREFPYEDRRPKFILYSPMRIAFRFPGTGILEASRELFRAVNRIGNLQIDGLQYSLMHQFEVDMSLLENPTDVKTGIEPGKFYRKRQGTNAMPAIREIAVTDRNLGGDTTQQFLHNEIQRGTLIPETLMGMSTAKGGDTATEIRAELASTTAILLSIAEQIEDECLSPFAEMTFKLMLQYLDSSTYPTWSHLLNNASPIDTWPAEVRKRVIGWDYQFEFFALSEAIRRLERAGNLLKTMEIIGQYPMFAMMVDVPSILNDLLKAIGTGAYVHPQAQQIYWQMVAMQLQAAQGQEEEPDMQEQFRARNEEAMKRDEFRHDLRKDEIAYTAGLKAALQPAQGEKK